MPKPSSKTNNIAIEVKDLSVQFDDNLILDHVSFSIEEGAIAAVIGPNGSGKTTLLRAMLGVIPKEGGSISILGQPLHHVRQVIGYIPQKFAFDPTFPMTVQEFLHLSQCKEGKTDAIDRVLKEVALPKKILTQKIGSLSGGQLQRVLIAQAIINDPKILILDEPATGVDVAGEAAFYKIIQHLNEEHGTTVILVSHDISMVSKSVDQVLCINHSLTCSGPPREALTKENIKEIFGEHTHAVTHHRKHK